MADLDAAKIEEQKDKATRTLMTMLDFLGLEASLRVEEKGSRLGIKISSPEAGRIIGRKGQSLESLQTLLDRILFRGEESGPRVMLDIDGYAQGNSRSGEGNDGEGAGNGEGGRPRRQFRDRDDRRGGRRREGGRGEGRSDMTEEDLRALALDKAKEVKKWGESVTLGEMNAHDRRIIHVTLQDDAELTTRSEGEGSMKKVVISLKKD
jgi:spoIIIJ-associated protein